MKTRTELLEQLEKELGALQVKTHRAGSKEEVWAIVDSILTHSQSQRVAFENRPLIRALGLEPALQKPGRHFVGLDQQSRKALIRQKDWEVVNAIEAGIGGADFALADTGTLVLFSATSSARWVSLAPKIHVVLLPEEKILASIDDLFDQFPAPGDMATLGSAIIFITGPSRTADIELKLVLGAHGPKEVQVVIMDFPIQSLTTLLKGEGRGGGEAT